MEQQCDSRFVELTMHLKKFDYLNETVTNLLGAIKDSNALAG